MRIGASTNPSARGRPPTIDDLIEQDDAALASVIASAIGAALSWHLESPEHTRNATTSSRTWRPASGPRGGGAPGPRDFGGRPPRDFGDRPRREFGERPARDFGDR